jgi:hypothetical protein
MSSRSQKLAVGLTAALIVIGIGAYVAYNEGLEWREKQQSDARRREEDAAIEERRQALAVEEKQRKERASLFEMLRTVDKTPFWQKNSFASLKEAYGVINDFKLADSLMIATMEKNPSTDERRLIETVQQKVAAGRRASYPSLRAAFGRFTQDTLRPDGFKVRVAGARNEVLNVDHKAFALSSSVQHAHDKMLAALQDFNFQRACYSSASVGANNTCFPGRERYGAVISEAVGAVDLRTRQTYTGARVRLQKPNEISA